MEIKNTFTSSRMNKDNNFRLLKDSEYIHAENLRFYNEGNNGVAQNIKGNLEISNIVSDVTNPKCVGATADLSSNRILYHIAGDNKCKLVEFNLTNNQTTIILEHNNLLGFSQDRIIYGMNEIDGLYYWVDTLTNAPRFCNIERAKTYGLNGFTENDISVIKKPPFEEPRLTFDYTISEEENDIEERYISFCYRYKYLDNEYSTLSFFSDIAFYPKRYQISIHEFFNEGMINIFNKVTVFFNTGDRNVKEVDICFRETNSLNTYLVKTINKIDEGYGDSEERSVEFFNNKIYTLIPEVESIQLYSNVPRKAFDQDLIGNRLVYGNYKEGYNQTDCNGNKIIPDYKLSIVSENISELNNIDIYTQDEYIEFDFDNQDLKNGRVLNFSLYFINVLGGGTNFEQEFLFTLPQDFTDILDLSTNTLWIDFIENQVKQSFIDEYVNLPNEILDSYTFDITYTANTIRFNSPTIIYKEYNSLPYDNTNLDFELHNLTFKASPDLFVLFTDSNSSKSLKSNRSYQAVISYYDDYNRFVGVLYDKEDNTVFNPHQNAIFKNQIKININNYPICGATKYKIAVRENKFSYQNLFLDKFYYDQIYVYFKLEGENKNKVSENDTIVLKSKYGEFYHDYKKVKVLSVTNELSNFIADNKQPINQLGTQGVFKSTPNMTKIIEEGGLYMKIKKEYIPFDEDDYKYLSANDYQSRRTTTPENFLKFCDGTVIEGALIKFSLNNRAYKTNNRGYREYILNKEYFAKTTYNNFKEFFETQVIELWGTFTETFTNGTLTTKNPYKFTHSWEVDGDGCDVLKITGGDRGLQAHPSRFGTTIEIQNNVTYIFETLPKLENSTTYHETIGTWEIINNQHELTEIILPHYNCYSWGNGIESYRIKDDWNTPELNHKFRPIELLKDGYKETHRATDLTYSDIFQKDTEYNGLSTFNLTEGNYFTCPYEQGHIQRIKSRDTDIAVFQQNKIGKVVYGKSVTADLKGIATAQDNRDVLSAYVDLRGLHGTINPESLVYDEDMIYIVDKINGDFIIIAGDQIKNLSETVVEQHWKELTKINERFIGGFDPENNEYLCFIEGQTNKILGYQIATDGHPSYYTFQTDYILGVNKRLFMWQNGVMFEQNVNPLRSTFFNQYQKPRLEFYANHFPSDDKVYKTMKLESTHAWDIIEAKTNLNQTDIKASEFEKKESYWFSYFNRNTNQDLSNAYGIGLIKSFNGNTLEFTSVPDYISIGDMFAINENFEREIVGITKNTITLNNIVGLSVGAFAYAKKNSRIDGEAIRGFYNRITMELNNVTDHSEIFAVSQEAFKSYL